MLSFLSVAFKAVSSRLQTSQAPPKPFNPEPESVKPSISAADLQRKEIDFIYEEGQEKLDKLGKHIRKYYARLKADQDDKYQAISNDLIEKFASIDTELHRAAKKGQSTVEISTDISRWKWERLSPESEQTTLIKRITKEELERRVKASNVTLEAFCPQFEFHKGLVVCLSKPDGEKRSAADCIEKKCWVAATLSSRGV